MQKKKIGCDKICEKIIINLKYINTEHEKRNDDDSGGPAAYNEPLSVHLDLKRTSVSCYT
jgi:hypothetical protein